MQLVTGVRRDPGVWVIVLFRGVLTEGSRPTTFVPTGFLQPRQQLPNIINNYDAPEGFVECSLQPLCLILLALQVRLLLLELLLSLLCARLPGGGVAPALP